MTLTRRLRAAVLLAGVSGGAAAAQAPVVPAGGAPKQVPYMLPPAGQPAPCPPAPFQPVPAQPGLAPVVPSQPGAATPPQQPGQPPAAQTPGQPPAPTPAPPPAPTPGALAQATERGGSADFSAKPGVFGDLFGGPAVPVAVAIPASGPLRQQLLAIPVLNTRTRQVRPMGQASATDELLFGRPAAVGTAPAAAGQTQVAVLGPDEVIVSPLARQNAVLIPQVSRGAFKITENDTPRPTTRAYVTYNFYDQLFKGYNPPGVGRLMLHQQNFGYEQATCDQRYSVGVRLPYNQLVGTGNLRPYSDTSVGDLTVILKGVIAEDRATGDLLSGGLAVTAPTGSQPFRTQVVSNPLDANPESIHPTLIQPFLGYIVNSGDVFLQGFTSVVVPTDSTDTTFLTQTLALGYTLFQRPGAGLTGIYPVFETHLNVPLNHRDYRSDVVGFADSLTLLTGAFFEFNSRSTVGFAAGTPVVGPRPFHTQATVQFNIRF